MVEQSSDRQGRQELRSNIKPIQDVNDLAGIGNVTGPDGAVDNAIARFDGTTGKVIQDYTSGAPTISDAGLLAMNAVLRFDTVVAVVASAYSIQRDTSPTNDLIINVPTSAQISLRINDQDMLLIDAVSVDINSLNLTSVGDMTFDSGATLTMPGSVVIASCTNWEFDVATLVHQTVSNSGGNVIYRVYNTSNTGSSRATYECKVAGASANDPAFLLDINGVQSWYMGLDNSQSDRYTISEGLPGTLDALRITASGRAITFDDSTGADFDYWCTKCGRHQLDEFVCCGPVEWHDDRLALRESRLTPAGFAHLVKLGVYEVDGPLDAQPGWKGINFQQAMHFTWSAMVQTWDAMDAQYSELDRRLQAIGA